jgi:hypothetical protein
MGDIGMLVTQEPFSHRQGVLVEGFGLPIAALTVVETGQIIEASGDRGMLVTQEPFSHRQGVLVEGFGLPIAPLGLVVIAGAVEE